MTELITGYFKVKQFHSPEIKIFHGAAINKSGHKEEN